MIEFQSEPEPEPEPEPEQSSRKKRAHSSVSPLESNEQSKKMRIYLNAEEVLRCMCKAIMAGRRNSVDGAPVDSFRNRGIFQFSLKLNN